MDSATDSGGRVTRALRKRLTSIDSDTSTSRPGTPVQTKLPSAGTNSPLKARMARRNSTSGVGTPAKTPGKRAANAVAAIAETEETNVTPARRVTRRSSITQIENEATPKLDVKASNCKPLEEEDVETRVTRSKSKSPEQAVVKAKSAWSQRGRRSMVRKDTVNLSHTKADTNVDIEKVDTANETSIISNKKENPEESNSSPTKRKSMLTENDKKKENLDESNSTTQKRKSLLTDVDNAKNNLNELSEIPMSLSSSIGTADKTSERTDDEENTIASPKKGMSLFINDTTADHKQPKKDDKNNSDDDRSNTSPPKRMSLSNSANTTYEKSPEEEEVDHIKTSQDKDADNVNTFSPDCKSLSISDADISRVPAEEPKIVVDKPQSNIKEEDRLSSPLKRQSLLNNKLPTNDDDHKSLECHDEQEIQVATLKSEENSTMHDDAQSSSVVLLKKDHVELLDGNMAENADTVRAENNNGNLSPETSEAASPNHSHDLQKQTDIMELEDVVSTNLNESVKTISVTSSPPSATTSDLNVNSITPDRNASRVKPFAGADGDSQKRVAFSSNVSEDECEKSIYPKTPASAKSKSFIEMYHSRNVDISFRAEGCSNNDSVVTIHDTTDCEIPETQQEDVESAKCPNKTMAEDDTIVSIVDDNNVTTEMENIASLSPTDMGDDKSIDKGHPQQYDTELCEESVVQNPTSSKSPDIKLRWSNPCVVAKDSKLDTITKGEVIVNKSVLCDDQFVKQKKKRTFMKRAEWNDESSYEEDADEEEEYDINAQKHPFHDDEVMVVDDYESGDSMDSEERREIMENEIAVDGESLGSHTTDGEDNDEDESENDSFIVSDNCDEEDIADNSRSEYDDEVEESNECSDGEKKKYKRIQRITETSSSDEDEPPKENLGEAKDVCENRDSDINLELKPNKSLNSSRLSDSARRLQHNPEYESDNSNKEDEVNISRKEILRKLNQSDRFDKSGRDLNPEVDMSADALATENTNNISVSYAHMNGTKNTKGVECAEVDSEEEAPTSTSGNASESELIESETINVKTLLSNSKQTESHLGEVSVTSEEENCNGDAGSGNDIDEEKENAVEQQMPQAIKLRGLSASLGTFKQQKTENSLQKKVHQRSFTIGVSVNGDALETEVFQNKVTESEVQAPSSPSASLSSNEDTDGDVLSSDDVRYLENIKHMPLGNPLVRTRRQSLALPTNPDMEIGPAQHSGAAHKTKNHKRKSLAILSGNEFNPSQSFVNSLELRKAELERQTSKRKRLSKSFGGTTADNSLIDIGVRHLHKRSKVSSENSFVVDSFEYTKPDNSMCLKVGHSSTPHEKGSGKKHNNSGIRRILNRCDEILEAANRAKLEAKLNYRKSKIRLPKKNKKRMHQQPSSPETKRDKVFAPITKEIKNREKAKIAVTQALKASADIIIGKQRKQPIEKSSVVSNRLPSDVLKSNADSQSIDKKSKTEHLTEKNVKYRNYSTAAGNVVEMLQSPERKKAKKIIRLPTGKVCVEPISPKKRSIVTCNGMEFHESPMTPSAVGFKVHEVLSSNGNNCRNNNRKRERNNEGRKHTFPTPQWTQSGLFIEEEISSARQPHSICHGRISKKTHLGQHQPNGSNLNFKQSALHRSDIKRCTAREVVQLRERRQMHDQY